jgi:hypothetical protein
MIIRIEQSANTTRRSMAPDDAAELVHGLVILEAFGHLAWSGRDVETMLADEVRSILKSFGQRVVEAQ